jgi:hypothetical protein|tara:strand:+ start:279 stop:821 length:543 start_codon:yes stop_codon:yes gene_type:complete
MLSWLGSVLILSNMFLYKISGIICFWGMILLLGYHILKGLKEPLKIELKNKIILLTIHLGYLVGIIYYLSDIILTVYKGAGMLTPAILFYETTQTRTGFLSVLLWFEKKKKTLSLTFGMILLILSGSLLAVKLFIGNTYFIENITKLCYISAQFLILYYFINVDSNVNEKQMKNINYGSK